ncbi:hypothetical protein [Chryseobacterium sp. IT-36CA2]|uniref:hypothetical protein n=1 Tax=Chryseobacterium sp. IT-36CA2 TaxID=3026460 RepID=UPI0039DFAF2C
MKKYNFRFVDQPEDPNIGLTIEEIAFLQKELNLQFPETYIYYLKNAGKKSNVFPVENDVIKLKKYQSQLKEALKKRDLLSSESLFCFLYNINYEPLVCRDFEIFYFFNLSDPKSPDLYVFGDFITNYDWQGYAKELTNKENFVDFINDKTKKKFGPKLLEKIGNIILGILLAPFIIIVLLIVAFQVLIEKIKNQ